MNCTVQLTVKVQLTYSPVKIKAPFKRLVTQELASNSGPNELLTTQVGSEPTTRHQHVDL